MYEGFFLIKQLSPGPVMVATSGAPDQLWLH